MKLYTEEQVRIMLGKARLLNMDDTEMFTDDYLIEQQTPIELPSDEEVENKALNFTEQESYGELNGDLWKGFVFGAKWVVNKIKGGQDERDRSIPE